MNKEQIEKINELKEKIDKLPKGYISTKTIGGYVYYYHQWSINGKKYSKYISEEELVSLNELISQRQELEYQLRAIKKGINLSTLLSYTLMHKDIEVIDLLIDGESGLIRTIGTLYSINHLPVGTFDDNGNVIEKELFDWWFNRSIPLSRSGIREALEKLNISTPSSLLIHCSGLSLSDQYWIKPKDKDIKWKDINFFDNAFSDDVGEIILGGNKKSDVIDLSSPDNTSVGNLKKKWTISKDRRVMIKGGSNPFRQEPFNEVVASKVANTLGIDSVQYSLFFDKGYPYSKCEDFISKDEDLITAFQINKTLKKNNNDNAYTHFLKCCEALGIKNAPKDIDKMIVFDFIIANEDRHLNNFGFIRDSSTLSFKKFAPIYDSGSSFGFDKISAEIDSTINIISKPFKSKPLEQLNLVNSFDWIDVQKLESVKELVKQEFASYESQYLDKERIKKIVNSCSERIDYLIKLIQK